MVSRSMKGRTASCTATRSVSGRERSQRVAPPIAGGCCRLPRRARPSPGKPRDSMPPTHSRSSARTATTISLDARRSREFAHRMHQNGRAFQQHELLAAGAGLFGGAFAHTGAQARGGQYHGDFHVYLRFYRGFLGRDVAHGLRIALAHRAVVPFRRPARRACARRTCRRSSCRRWSAARWSRRCRWSWRSSSWRCPPPPWCRRPGKRRPGCTPCLPSG